MKRWLLIFPALLLAACGKGGDASDANASDEPIAEVRVATAVLGSANGAITAYGATEAGPGATRSLVAPAEAIVDAVLAPTGTAVGVGQAVVSLRPSRTSRLDTAKAQSDVRAANAAYARAVRLRKDGLASDAEVETARAAAASARAAVANTGIGGGLTLRAPAAGTVQGLTAKPGDQLPGGTTVATIVGRGDLRARFGVDPVVAPRIHPGTTAQIQLAGGTPITVPIVGVDPSVDATTRLASVFVQVPSGLSLAAGEPLRATVQVGASSQGITIPYAALLDDGGRSYVFVVQKGVAKRVDVSPGNSAGDSVQILRGLRPGDQVVTEGGTALDDGMKVKIVGVGR
jgi:RND family efflux transporter MFP subunit